MVKPVDELATVHISSRWLLIMLFSSAECSFFQLFSVLSTFWNCEDVLFHRRSIKSFSIQCLVLQNMLIYRFRELDTKCILIRNVIKCTMWASYCHYWLHKFFSCSFTLQIVFLFLCSIFCFFNVSIYLTPHRGTEIWRIENFQTSAYTKVWLW